MLPQCFVGLNHPAQFSEKRTLSPEASAICPLPSGLLSGSHQTSPPELTDLISGAREIALDCDGAARRGEGSFHDASHEGVNQGWRHLSPLLDFIQNLPIQNRLVH